MPHFDVRVIDRAAARLNSSRGVNLGDRTRAGTSIGSRPALAGLIYVLSLGFIKE
jgi:hypothetical protein